MAEPLEIAERKVPRMGDLVLVWRDRGFDSLAEEFPMFADSEVDWCDPFCFRCGWRAPTKSADEYPEAWKDDRAFTYAWNAATGWLERAHLRDHSGGGDGSPENLVALCVLCHEEQPVCPTREEGVAFVASRSPRFRIRPWLQMCTDLYGDQRLPGKSAALRKMLRAQGRVALVLAEAAEKTLKELE